MRYGSGLRRSWSHNDLPSIHYTYRHLECRLFDPDFIIGKGRTCPSPGRIGHRKVAGGAVRRDDRIRLVTELDCQGVEVVVVKNVR